MKRPLTLDERFTVTPDPGPSPHAGVSNMVLHLAFLLGQCVGQYPTGSCHLTIREKPRGQTLHLTAEIVIPLKELGT